MLLVAALLFFCTPASAVGKACDSEWNSGEWFCYKHFFNKSDLVNYNQASSRCKALGAVLAPVTNQNVLTLLGATAKRQGNGWYPWRDTVLLGPKRNAKGKFVHDYDLDWMFYPKFCPGWEKSTHNCVVMVVDNLYNRQDGKEVRKAGPACLIPVSCEGRVSRYICQKPMTKNPQPIKALPPIIITLEPIIVPAPVITQRPIIVCSNPHTVNVNGVCRCADGYIDITETDVPERVQYRQGDKCIPKDPCRNAKDLTVNFIVDSSQSIGSANWNSLVEFLRSGADFLPSTTRVGFIKYSTTVTFSQFLAAGWSRQTFREFVPSAFDNGGTNTPLALSKASEMFDSDFNQNRVAILITDGMPFDENLNEEDCLNKTIDAAKALRAKRVSLIALGYGESLGKKGHQFIRQLVEDPQEDYFDYDKMACDFKSLHMSILMRKVCRRFVKD